jgi:hypothetical protein
MDIINNKTIENIDEKNAIIPQDEYDRIWKAIEQIFVRLAYIEARLEDLER